MDLVNRKAAIDVACKVCEVPNIYKCKGRNTTFKWCEEISKLLDLPTAEPHRMGDFAEDTNVPTNDCISRRAAIDALISEGRNVGSSYPAERIIIESDAIEVIAMLPSAQPEIIRCKDCKWWGYDDDNEVVRVCHAAKHGHMSRNWSIMIYRTHKGDFYCADAERRTDE